MKKIKNLEMSLVVSEDWEVELQRIESMDEKFNLCSVDLDGELEPEIPFRTNFVLHDKIIALLDKARLHWIAKKSAILVIRPRGITKRGRPEQSGLPIFLSFFSWVKVKQLIFLVG